MSASQASRCILWNPKVHSLLTTAHQLTIPKPTYTVHAILLDFFKIHFNIILLSMPRHSVISLFQVSPPKPCICFSSLPLCYKPYPSYPPYSKHHKSWHFLPHNLHQPPVTSSLFGPFVLVCTLFSNNNMQISNFTFCKVLIKGYKNAVCRLKNVQCHQHFVNHVHKERKWQTKVIFMPEDWLSWQARTITLGTVVGLPQHAFHTHIKMAHVYKLYYFQHLLLFHLKQLYFAKVWQFLHSPSFHDSKRVKLPSNLGSIYFWKVIQLKQKRLK